MPVLSTNAHVVPSPGVADGANTGVSGASASAEVADSRLPTIFSDNRPISHLNRLSTSGRKVKRLIGENCLS